MDQYSPAYFFMTNSDQADARFITYSRDKSYSNKDSSDQEDDEYNPYLDNHLKPVTKTIKKSSKAKRGYVTVSNELRLELIEAVHSRGEKVKFAAKRLGINYSSAKAICQIYKREGRSDKKVPRKSSPEEEEEKVIYAIQSTPVFVSSGNESPVEPAIDQAKEDTAENQTNRTSSTKESVLVVKDPVMMTSYPEVERVQEPNKIPINHQVFHQPEQFIPRTTQNNLVTPQQAFPANFPYLAIQHPTVMPSMPSFPSNQPILLSNMPIQLGNGNQNLTNLTVPNQPLFLNQIKPQNFPMQVQPQISYIYPQPINIASSQMGSTPLMVNPVYYVPTQNINMSVASFPQSVPNETIYRSPYYSQGIYRNPGGQNNNAWNGQSGNGTYSIQNYNNNENKFEFPR